MTEKTERTIQVSADGFFLDVNEKELLVGWKSDAGGVDKWIEDKYMALPRDALSTLLLELENLDIPESTPTATFLQGYTSTQAFIFGDIGLLSKVFSGKLYVSIRKLYKKYGRDEWIPGKPGTSFGFLECSNLIKALTKLDAGMS